MAQLADRVCQVERLKAEKPGQLGMLKKKRLPMYIHTTMIQNLIGDQRLSMIMRLISQN